MTDDTTKARDEARARELANEFFGGDGSAEQFELDLILFVLGKARAERDAELQRPDVVERVAMAMYEDAPELRDVLEPDEGAFTWEQLYEADRDLWRRRSRAALAAAVGGTKP